MLLIHKNKAQTSGSTGLEKRICALLRILKRLMKGTLRGGRISLKNKQRAPCQRDLSLKLGSMRLCQLLRYCDVLSRFTEALQKTIREPLDHFLPDSDVAVGKTQGERSIQKTK